MGAPEWSSNYGWFEAIGKATGGRVELPGRNIQWAVAVSFEPRAIYLCIVASGCEHAKVHGDHRVVDGWWKTVQHNRHTDQCLSAHPQTHEDPDLTMDTRCVPSARNPYTDPQETCTYLSPTSLMISPPQMKPVLSSSASTLVHPARGSEVRRVRRLTRTRDCSNLLQGIK